MSISSSKSGSMPTPSSVVDGSAVRKLSRTVVCLPFMQGTNSMVRATVMPCGSVISTSMGISFFHPP